MKDLNFNIYAFARPSTLAEYSALLDEAIRMGHQLEAMVDAMSATLAQNAAEKAARAAPLA